MSVSAFVSVINRLLPEPQASLLGGMLFGIHSQMPKDFYQALVKTGTLHIIALSGMNISILIAIFSKIFFSLGRRTGSLLTVLGIIGFVFFVGPSPSVVRAAIMGSLTMISIYSGRQRAALLSLFLAAMIMLIFNLRLIFDIGFQLSFLATLGIILLAANRSQELIKEKSFLKKAKWGIGENFKTTLAAQIFTLPVIFYNFHRVSLISPLVNVLVGWVISPITGGGMITAVLGYLFLPLGQVLAWFLWVPLTYFIEVVKFFSQFPGASLEF